MSVTFIMCVCIDTVTLLGVNKTQQRHRFFDKVKYRTEVTSILERMKQ